MAKWGCRAEAQTHGNVFAAAVTYSIGHRLLDGEHDLLNRSALHTILMQEVADAMAGTQQASRVKRQVKAKLRTSRVVGDQAAQWRSSPKEQVQLSSVAPVLCCLCVVQFRPSPSAAPHAPLAATRAPSGPGREPATVTEEPEPPWSLAEAARAMPLYAPDALDHWRPLQRSGGADGGMNVCGASRRRISPSTAAARRSWRSRQSLRCGLHTQGRPPSPHARSCGSRPRSLRRSPCR